MSSRIIDLHLSPDFLSGLQTIYTKQLSGHLSVQGSQMFTLHRAKKLIPDLLLQPWSSPASLSLGTRTTTQLAGQTGTLTFIQSPVSPLSTHAKVLLHQALEISPPQPLFQTLSIIGPVQAATISAPVTPDLSM